MSRLDEASLQGALRQAMKNRAAVEVAVLRGLLAAIKNAGIERRTAGTGDLVEADLVQIVRREIKQREEAIEFAERGKRADLVERNREERAILERFLPQGPSREEVEAAVLKHYETGATAIGPLMARLKAEFGVRLDGRVASEVVRDVLRQKGGS